MTNVQTRTYYELLAADEAWSNELRRCFGKSAGTVRYTPQGKSTPKLKALHDAVVLARIAWNGAYGRTEGRA